MFNSKRLPLRNDLLRPGEIKAIFLSIQKNDKIAALRSQNFY